jgi:hypothetical protein
MKKFFLILVGMVLAVGVLATAGFVYAATDDPPETEPTEDNDTFFHRGFMGRRGGFKSGFLGRGEGILHDYMFPAIAEIFGLSEDQVEAFENVQETMKGIRDDLSPDEIQANMKEAFTSAANDALKDEAITQEQYDQMLERMEQMGNRGFGSMGRRGLPGGFRFDGARTRGSGMFQEYIEPALAAALNVSLDELQTMKEDGLNLNDYAVENGMTVEELQNLMVEVHTTAIQAAFDDGAITEDQYDMMKEHLENSDGRLPFGPGFKGQRHPGW